MTMDPQKALYMVDRLREACGALDGIDLLRVVLGREFSGRIAVTSSFGAEAAVLLDLVAQVDPATPVIFLDTDALFDETLEYQAELTRHLGLTDVRIIRPDQAARKEADELWRSDADRCCYLRKVLPLERAVAEFTALIDGRKRAHGNERAHLNTIEAGPDGRIKISPLAPWSAERIEAHFVERGLPRHPLVAQGYRSIGCYPCTRPVAEGEDIRSGRWAGLGKTECGIHKPVGGH